MSAIAYMLMIWGYITSPGEAVKYENYLTEDQLQHIEQAYDLYQELLSIEEGDPAYDDVKKQFIIMSDDLEI